MFRVGDSDTSNSHIDYLYGMAYMVCRPNGGLDKNMSQALGKFAEELKQMCVSMPSDVRLQLEELRRGQRETQIVPSASEVLRRLVRDEYNRTHVRGYGLGEYDAHD